MKKIVLLIAVMSLAIMSCTHNPKPNTPENGSTGKVDMVVIQHGQMLFYNQETQALTPFEAEKDSVVNIAFDNENHLYYTAAKQQDLVLKVLDLSKTNPKPEIVYDWKLTLLQINDIMYGTGASDLQMDVDGKLYLVTNNPIDEPDFYVEAFNTVSGEAYEMSFTEYMELFYGQESFDRDHFYNEKDKFYHATPEGKVCLNDKINFANVFEDSSDLEDLFFYPVNCSPNGQKIVYAANVEIGEGWGYYCVASSDGQSQDVLKDSDIWTMEPKWLSNGSLVYVGKEPRPKDDPTYEEHWNDTRHCVTIMTPDGETSVLASDAENYFVNPFGTPQSPKKERQEDLDADMAIIDNGKVVFYNSVYNTFTPLVVEDDYVVNGVFGEDGVFYYTVAIGDELYLKEVYMGFYRPYPDMLTDWDLKLSDCYDENSGKTAPIYSYLNAPVVKMDFDYMEEYEEFQYVRYYNYQTQMKTDQRPDNIELTYDTDDRREQFMSDMEMFRQQDVEVEGADEDKSYYYYFPENSADHGICISDKIDFDKYKYSEYSYEPQFEFLGISPKRDFVIYGAPIEWGHVGHGPLCFATLDGTVQKVLATDFNDMCYGWLGDGRLAYSDNEGIKVVSPDGTEEKISDSHVFVTMY